MVVNLDVLILENIIVNYFLLSITSRTLRLRKKFKDIILPALIGGVYVITLIYPQLRIFTELPFKLLTAFIMIFVLFRNKSVIFNFKASIIYILYSMVLAGLCFFVEFNNNPFIEVSGFKFNFSYKVLTLCLILIYLIIDRLVIYIKDRKEVCSLIYTVDIFNKDTKKRVAAFLDTGNELREPATNLPVMIIEKDLINNFYINEKEKLYIPYKVVNGYKDKLVGFKPEYIKIYSGKEIMKREVIIAFCDNKLSDLNDYNALLSRGII